MPTLIRPVPAPLATCRECKGRIQRLSNGEWMHVRYKNADHPVVT